MRVNATMFVKVTIAWCPMNTNQHINQKGILIPSIKNIFLYFFLELWIFQWLFCSQGKTQRCHVLTASRARSPSGPHNVASLLPCHHLPPCTVFSLTLNYVLLSELTVLSQASAHWYVLRPVSGMSWLLNQLENSLGSFKSELKHFIFHKADSHSPRQKHARSSL